MTTTQYRKYDEDFKQGAVRLVTETGKPVAQVARELGVNEGKDRLRCGSSVPFLNQTCAVSALDDTVQAVGRERR